MCFATRGRERGRANSHALALLDSPCSQGTHRRRQKTVHIVFHVAPWIVPLLLPPLVSNATVPLPSSRRYWATKPSGGAWSDWYRSRTSVFVSARFHILSAAMPP
jgi:hypothetical protein